MLIKKSITKINAFLVISELMASFGKVLRSFGIIGKKNTAMYQTIFILISLDKLLLCENN